ncbi:MAG: glutamate 5-kinase [Bacillota bacterium]|nr:glutamate 5-kinase [Bacillota bacterium]
MKKPIHKALSDVNRIVVKVGTSSLTHRTGKLNIVQLEKLVRSIADLSNQEYQVVLVSSGAIGAGVGKMGLKERPKTIPEKQAAAAVGQGILLHMYEKLFGEYGQTVAQVLLTKDDLNERKRYLNARNALLTLLSWGTIPIINENDTLAVDEIRFGDNDTLAALVAGLVDADLLILLTDIDGLYTANPKTNRDAQLITEINEITPEIVDLAGGAGSSLGTGGMVTKVHAAKISMNFGIPMVIANGGADNILTDIMIGKAVGTLFNPKDHKLHSKKRWIAYGSDIQGEILVDSGAADAIVNRGKSLLAIGVTGVKDSFEMGGVVRIIDPQGIEIARGIVNYSSKNIDLIKGVRSNKIADIIGHNDYEEIIHRDNMTVKV